MLSLLVILGAYNFFDNVASETHFFINFEPASQNGVLPVKHKSNESCVCLPYYQCSAEESGEVIADGRGLLDLRILKTDECEGDFDICCEIRDDAPVTVIDNPSSDEYQGCGYFNPNATHTWTANLLFQSKGEFTSAFKCGASLIHRKAAITAAHCLNEPGIYALKIGNSIRRIVHHAIHEQYSRKTMQNDIAILILDKSIDANPICIPPPGILLEPTTTVGCKAISTRNNTLELVLVPREDCVKELRRTRLGEYFQLHRSFLCAGGGGESDTCWGDGGSALICPIPNQPNRFHQVGIVSWGIGCGNGLPGVYVNVPKFRQWIDRILMAKGIDIVSYRY